MICRRCRSVGRLDPVWCAHYCEACNLWLDGRCPDPDCPHCSARPATPRSACRVLPFRTQAMAQAAQWREALARVEWQRARELPATAENDARFDAAVDRYERARRHAAWVAGAAGGE